jgi:chromosome segregation ATPase
MDTLQADLTRVSAEMQELQEQAQIEKTRAQDELRLALAQKDEQIEALQGELSRSVADIETEKRRACDQMATACTALNAGRQRRLTLRVFFGWARQACVGAMINGIMIGSEEGDTSSSQPQRSTSVVAVRAAAEEYAKVFAVKVEVEAKRSREEQLAVSAKQIRTELENQMQSEIAQVVAKSHAELEEMQETLVRVQESIEHRIGTATRTQELAQKHQAISASKAAELERAAHAANADISMLKRQLEKTTQVAAEKLDEESSQREAAEARATAAEKQARRAADKARAAEAVIADERALRLAAEADLAAVKKSRSALESREINRHKKEADMRKAFEEAAWRKAQDEKKAREAAERKLSQVTRPASSPAKRKAPRKAAEQATQLSTPSKTSRDHVATPDRSASSARRTTGTDDSAAVGSRRTTTTEHADAVVGYDSSDQTPWRDDAGVVADGNASVSLSRLLEEFRDCVRSDFTEVRRASSRRAFLRAFSVCITAL